MAKKVEVIVTDESGKQTAFGTKTLTKEFKNKQGKKYKVAIQEPGQNGADVGTYTVIDGTIDRNKAPIIEAGESKTVKPGDLVILDAAASDPEGGNVEVTWIQEGGTIVVLDIDETDTSIAQFIAPADNTIITFACFAKDEQGLQTSDKIVITVDDGTVIPPPPPPPTGDVLYDSLVDSKLHDKNVRTIKKEGSISPNGLGIECRASGNPRNVVNADGTFSLICDKGHGRDYLYVLNYNATLEIECAFWNEVAGQDLSLKMRSDHNEAPSDRPDAESWDGVFGDAFGGIGLSIDRAGWGAKIEPEHNFHPKELAKSGKLPKTPKTKEYFTIQFTVKDDGDGIRQIGKMDGVQFMDKLDEGNNVKDWMKDPKIFAKQSYLWIRQNVDSGTGEIRIKRVRVLKA